MEQNIEPKDDMRVAFEKMLGIIFPHVSLHDIKNSNEFIYRNALAADLYIAWQAATAARDAHWREKLQSEEMAEALKLSMFNYVREQKMLPPVKQLDSIEMRNSYLLGLAGNALAAISKEMGV